MQSLVTLYCAHQYIDLRKEKKSSIYNTVKMFAGKVVVEFGRKVFLVDCLL